MKSQQNPTPSSPNKRVNLVRTFPRFKVSQRWEHAILLLCIAILSANRFAPKI